MFERYFRHVLTNGLTLVCEKMPGVSSAAMTLLVPAGVSGDPDSAIGCATVLSDLVLRGAGDRDNRALTEYLDGLGLQRSAGVGTYHTRFGSAALAPRVLESLSTYADVLMRPMLPANGFESAKELAIQALQGLNDDPRQKLLVLLREAYFPSPYGRNNMGKIEHLQALTHEQAKGQWYNRYNATGAILSLAGDIDIEQVKSEVERLFGQWKSLPEGKIQPQPTSGRHRHENQDSEQTHIGLAYPSIPETHDDYYVLRLALEVLSGGMSGRLFTEVREKRGLCYSVWAGLSGLKDSGSVLGYAGTSNDRAQATLDCMLAEIVRMSDGITQDELNRAKTGVKASTIMQGESTSARAGAIAHDTFMRGRIRTMAEIIDQIDAVTLDRVNAYLKANPPGNFTIVTVGPKELSMPT